MCPESAIDSVLSGYQIEQMLGHLRLLVVEHYHLDWVGNQFEPGMMFAQVRWTENQPNLLYRWLVPLCLQGNE